MSTSNCTLLKEKHSASDLVLYWTALESVQSEHRCRTQECVGELGQGLDLIVIYFARIVQDTIQRAFDKVERGNFE